MTSRRSIVSVAVTSRHLIETKITTSHESRDAARALALSLSLVSRSADGDILGLDKVAKIFSNIEDIALINEALLKQLDERIRIDESDRVG